jgi:hypothetical protein
VQVIEATASVRYNGPDAEVMREQGDPYELPKVPCELQLPLCALLYSVFSQRQKYDRSSRPVTGASTMQPLYEPAVGDIVFVERNHHWGDRVPRAYRNYVTMRTYLFKARVVRICNDKPYHRVVPIPWNTWDTDIGGKHSRKAHRTKMFRLNDG